MITAPDPSIARDVIQMQAVENRELVVIMWRRRWLIAGCGVLFTVVLGVIGFSMTPLYRGITVLVPVSADRSALGGSLGSSLGSMSGLAALAGLDLSSRDEEVQETLAVIRSKEFTENFILHNNLMPELFPKLWNAQIGRWNVPPEKQPTMNRAFRVFDKLRMVTKETKTGLITLQIDWPDRFKAARLTNEMVRELNDEMRSRAAKAADASLVYLQKELSTTTEVGTREAVSRLIESQVKQRMLANVTQEYSLRFVDRALTPDANEKVSPRKALMMIAGLLFGVIVGMTIALLSNAYRIATQRPS